MGQRKFQMKYGRTGVDFEIPESHLLYELMGRNRPPLPDLAGAYLRALDKPIDSPPLKELIRPGQKVAITVSDVTRAWQRNADTLPLLLDYLNRAGVADKDVTVIIAVGAHRLNTEKEFAELCGDAVCHRVRVVNHDARDEANMVYLGRTSRDTEVYVNRLVLEADRVIMTGGVIYHYMVGYGGGRKSVLPGVSGIRTIQRNHLWAMGPNLGDGSNPLSANKMTVGNPVHEDMMEIAAFIKPDFIVNVVPNFDGGLIGVFAGNWVSAWWEATKLVDQVFAAPIEEKADIVVASAGGYPRDINFYQSQKTLDNACYALKPGGVAVMLAECPDIAEPREFFDWFRFSSDLEQERALRADFTIAGWVAYKQVEYCNRYQVILLTRPENAALAAKAHVRPVSDMGQAVKLAYDLCGLDAPKVTIMPFGANTFPLYSPR